MSFSLYTVIAEGREKKAGNDRKAAAGPRILQCTDTLGARVALLQSPILPVAKLFYTQSQNFPRLPVDKPHTHHPWLDPLFRSGPCLCVLARPACFSPCRRC